MRALDGHVWHDIDDDWLIQKKIKNGKIIWARVERCQDLPGKR